jgi:hypothetical protein
LPINVPCLLACASSLLVLEYEFYIFAVMTSPSLGYDGEIAMLMARAAIFAYEYYESESGEASHVPYQFGQFEMGPKIEVSELGRSLFFGFAAKGRFDDDSPFVNLIALRGTRTSEEAFYDIGGWTLKPCCLPAGSQDEYGNCASFLYDFYTGDDLGLVTSLANSFKNAVGWLDDGQDPWYLTAHSLGGAMANLGALDAMVSGYHTKGPIHLYTFGSLHVGDRAFKENQEQFVAQNFRVANLADFVPSLTGISADTPGYEHTGTPCTFLWQTDGDWGNHSMQNIYLSTVMNYPAVIQVGPRAYPQ